MERVEGGGAADGLACGGHRLRQDQPSEDPIPLEPRGVGGDESTVTDADGIDSIDEVWGVVGIHAP